MVNLRRSLPATETNRVSKCSLTTVYAVIVGPSNICSFPFFLFCFLAFHILRALHNFLTGKKPTIESMQSRGTVKLKQGLAMVCVFSLRIQEVFTPEGESSA